MADDDFDGDEYVIFTELISFTYPLVCIVVLWQKFIGILENNYSRKAFSSKTTFRFLVKKISLSPYYT